MDFRFPRFVIMLTFLVLLPVNGLATEVTDEFSDFSELNLENLLNQTVVSASKHEQVISESPVAVTIITADEIAASGIANIPDILRDIAGLDVIVMTAGDFNVSARGLNKSGANSTLVMIDGRAVYEEFYGTTLWKSLPVALAAIKSIEVIKGPGSAFYGANAFAAVINIITFDPAEMLGTQVSARAGNQGESLSSVVHAGQSGNYSWRMSGDVERALNWELDMTDLDMTRLTGRLDRQLSDNSATSFSGGYTSGLQSFQPGGAQMNLDGETSFMRADYRAGNFQARWFWNCWALNLIPFGADYLSDLSYMDSNIHDFEVQHAPCLVIFCNLVAVIVSKVSSGTEKQSRSNRTFTLHSFTTNGVLPRISFCPWACVLITTLWWTAISPLAAGLSGSLTRGMHFEPHTALPIAIPAIWKTTSTSNTRDRSVLSRH